MNIRIDERIIGAGYPTYIVAEIGVNHNGSDEIAGRLISVAKEAGCDAVKFQKRTIDMIATAEYLDMPLGEGFGEIKQRAQREQLELSVEQHARLKENAEHMGLHYFCSSWDEQALEEIDSLGVVAHKIASADLTNEGLIRATAAKKKPMIVSTGMASEVMVDRAVELLKSTGTPFALLQCTSTYPSEYHELDLKAMFTMRTRYQVPIGFSGHERGIHIPVAAVALGACIIEKHITLDRSFVGPDHAASLEPAGLKKLVRNIRDVETAMGKPDKVCYHSEFPVIMKLRKSVVSRVAIPPGDVIHASDLVAKGPGTGIGIERIEEVIGKKAARHIAADKVIQQGDVQWR